MKFLGVNLLFFGNLLGSNWKYEDQNAKFEKLYQWRILKFLTFRCHLKFSKFKLNKIHHKFPSFWKFFKLYPNNGIHLKVYPNYEIHLKVFEFPQNILPSRHNLSLNGCIGYSWARMWDIIVLNGTSAN